MVTDRRFIRGISAVCVFLCLPNAGVAQSADAQPAFEVATIKPSTHADLQGIWGTVFPALMRGGPGTSRPGQISFQNASLKSILTAAYGVKRYQISGPAWLETTGFNIVAKLPAGAIKEQIQPMLRNLLAERFKLAVHRESRDLPAFALAIAKGGQKLTPAQHPGDRGGSFGPWKGNARWVTTSGTMLTIAEYLTLFMERPVIDRTGLTGEYDFTLYWTPEYPMVLVAPKSLGAEGEAADPAPTIFNALQDQLGLKLEPGKLPLEVVVIDHIEKTPTEN